ncbi:MAG: TraB/GumN family protein [Pseudomonadota bacterium]
MIWFQRLLLCLFLAVPTFAAAQDQCRGVDLIDALEEAERQKIFEEAAAEQFGKGLFWRAEKDDTTLTIFGTYHFKHSKSEVHLERLKPFLDQADKIYLEISNEDQAKMQVALTKDPSMMFIVEGPTLADMLDKTTWQSFQKEMQARNIPSFLAAKFKPMWAAMMLGIGPCEAQAGALEGGGIDQLVGEYATAIGNPSRSLEQFDELLALLDDMPVEQQLNMIEMSLAWPGNMDDLSYTIRERYLNEEVALTWIFSKYISLEFGGETAEEDFAKFSELLLERRNNDWMTVLDDEVSDGDQVVIAVGAGHLPGEIGILRLLQKRGYAIERLPLFED